MQGIEGYNPSGRIIQTAAIVLCPIHLNLRVATVVS